ncbi:hypothetical protein BDZ89DRAFT_796803 [Hymenopellis radicata]|nr:hypothetical protein BDZ89DRAFT_796803 [Hymenopellis radicata]
MTDECNLDIPFEIKCAILEHVENADLGNAALIWPDMLPYIRRRTFASVVISNHANYSPDAADLGAVPRRIQNSLHNLHNVLTHTPKIAENIRVFHLREPMKTHAPLVISQHVILPQLFGHIPEMTNLQCVILERLNFLVIPDPTALPRALRCCTFRLDTLQIKNCLMSMDVLTAILRAVVDVQFLDLSLILRFGEFDREVEVNWEDPALVDYYDDMEMDGKRLPKVKKEKVKEFLYVDTLRLHVIGDAEHRFVDFLGSERYSPLCNVRVLEIEHLSGADQNLVNSLNRLLAHTSHYLEELSIFRASTTYDFPWGSCINLAHISTFKFWTRIECCYRWWWLNDPWAWALEQERFVKLYAMSLENVPKTSKLRELEVSLVIDIIDINVMPRVERPIWDTLDAALTAKNLKEILETLVLNVYVVPVADLAQFGEITEQYMADFEDWILAECLPATRRTYFERDERGVIFCENAMEMSRGASSNDELSRLVELCSPTSKYY